jgi:hypothetical protein
MWWGTKSWSEAKAAKQEVVAKVLPLEVMVLYSKNYSHHLLTLNHLGRQSLYGLVVGQKHLAVKMLQETGGVELVHHRTFYF